MIDLAKLTDDQLRDHGDSCWRNYLDLCRRNASTRQIVTSHDEFIRTCIEARSRGLVEFESAIVEKVKANP